MSNKILNVHARFNTADVTEYYDYAIPLHTIALILVGGPSLVYLINGQTLRVYMHGDPAGDVINNKDIADANEEAIALFTGR